MLADGACSRSVKHVGNYSEGTPRVERKPATVVSYQGPRALIRFFDGLAYAMPSAPLRQLNLVEGTRFMMVIVWHGRRPASVRVEPIAPGRPALDRHGTPKVYIRVGQKMATRRRM